MAQPFITINGQQIPFPFIQKIRTIFGGDWDRTIDAFWKARKATGENGIIRYIKAGLKPDAKGNRYSMLPSKEREGGEKTFAQVRKWWETEVYQRKRPARVNDEMRKFFLELAGGQS